MRPSKAQLSSLILKECNMDMRQFSKETEIPYDTLTKYSRGMTPRPERVSIISKMVGIGPKELRKICNWR